MNKRDLKKFEKMLRDEYDRLTEGIRSIEESSRDSSAHESGTSLANYAEVGTDNFERETMLHIASDESQRLQDIADALARIDQGGFGTCEGCSETIPKKRLEVFPSARYCVHCQSKIEKDGVL